MRTYSTSVSLSRLRVERRRRHVEPTCRQWNSKHRPSLSAQVDRYGRLVQSSAFRILQVDFHISQKQRPVEFDSTEAVRDKQAR
jgi:hypothetical protein